MAFKEFQSCSKESFGKCLDKCINREWDLGGFDVLLQYLSKNKKIKKQQRRELLINYTGFNFINKLIDTINSSEINNFTCQNIANIINNLSKVGLTLRDLQGDSFAKAVIDLINDILDLNYNFKPQEISNTINGLAKLGYKKDDLKNLNIKALTEQINNQIEEFEPQHIANTFNGLAKLGYGKKDLNGLDIGNLIQQINKQINNFNSQDISLTLHGLGKIGYNFDELKESNIIQNLLKKFNSIQKNKTVLDYLTLMKGLAATVYDIKQDNLKEEQKQYLNELKTNIDKDVKKIVKGAKEKRKEITNATNLDDLNRVLIILGKQQAELEQQTKKVIEDEQRLERCSEKCKNTETTILESKLCAITETNKALNNITDAVLQKQ